MQLLSQFVLSTLMLVSGWLGLVAEQPANVISSASTSDSVELGILELSPNGPAGGYAMPASNDSRCGIGDADVCDEEPINPTPRTYECNMRAYASHSDTTAQSQFPVGTDIVFRWDNDIRGLSAFLTRNVTPPSVAVDGVFEPVADLNASELPPGSYTYSINFTNVGGTWNCAITVTIGSAQCRDGIDNSDPEDSLIDATDPGCWTDPDDPATYDPNDDNETDTERQCEDGIDNDGDGLNDVNDSGCWTDPDDPATYDPNDDDETDTTNEPLPTATMRVCDLGNSNCVSGPNGSKSIPVGTELEIRWSSTNADTCTFIRWDGNDGSGDGNDLSGIDTTITEPLLGSSVSYQLRCSNSEGNSPVQTVTVSSVSAAALCPDGGTISADPSVIRRGDTSVLTWIPPDENGYSCTISGANFVGSNQTSITVSSSAGSCETDPVTVAPVVTTDYTLNCASITDTTTVRVLPMLEET